MCWQSYEKTREEQRKLHFLFLPSDSNFGEAKVTKFLLTLKTFIGIFLPSHRDSASLMSAERSTFVPKFYTINRYEETIRNAAGTAVYHYRLG